MQGCFWGVENYFNKHFKQGLIDSEVGYTGGETDDPNYRMVWLLPIPEIRRVHICCCCLHYYTSISMILAAFPLAKTMLSYGRTSSLCLSATGAGLHWHNRAC